MGIFSDLASPISGAVDIGLGFIAGGKQKGAIDEARNLTEAQLGENISATGAVTDRGIARLDPYAQTGYDANSQLQNLILGDGRLQPTAAETYAQQQALEGIDRGAAANKSLMSGRRLEDLANASAQIGSQFRQQGLNNISGLANRGFNATGATNQLDLGGTAEQNRLRELLGGVQSGSVLAKTGIDTANIANIGTQFGNSLSSLGGMGGVAPLNNNLSGQTLSNWQQSPVYKAAE